MTTETLNGPSTVPPTTDRPATTPTTIPLHRSRTDRVLAGVCGGFAEMYGADPTAVRILAVVLTVATGILPMLIGYLLAAVFLPEAGEAPVEGGAAAVPRRIDAGQGALIVGVVLIVGGAAALANELLRIDWALIWPAALIVLGGLLVVMALRRRPEGPRP